MIRIFKTAIMTMFILLLVNYALDAQTLQGSVKYTETHNWVKKISALEYLPASHKERMAYMFANRASWTEFTSLKFSPQASLYEELGESPESYSGYSYKRDEYLIYRDLENNKTIDLIKMLGKLYLIEDVTINPQWKILNDMREIAGHICMNALWTDSLKGQRIIAWFALDIPVSSGPERFGGLPGLILEIDINNQALLITAESITIEDMSEKINPPKYKKVRKITNLQFLEIIRKHIEEKKKEEEPWFYGLRY